MKLPSEPALNIKSSSPAKPTSGDAQVSQSSAPSKSQQALPASIQALINTWAKVESSQTLPDKQNQQVLNQLALLTGNHPKGPIADPATQSGISEKLSLSNLAQNLSKNEVLSDSLKLVLVKLMSIKGSISILSDRPLTPNSQVLLRQSPEGKLTIHNAQNPTPLNQFRSQFIAQNFTLKPIVLIDGSQSSTKESRTRFTFTPIPNVTLQSEVPLAPNILKQALINSGQNLESKIAQLLQSQPMTTKPSAEQAQSLPQSAQNQTSQNKAGATHNTNNTNNTNMQSKITQVEQSIQKWVSQFQQKVTGSTSTQNQPPEATSSTNSVAPKILDALKNTQNPTSSNSISSDSLKHDHKNWLIQNQNQMLTQLSKQLLQRKDSFIPNWPAMQFQGASAGSSIKTFQDLSQWLTLLMMPKASSDNHGDSLWPKPLAVQPQLQQTLSALLNSFNQSNNDSEAALLRQLLSITQNLSKLTHDQIQNRFLQTQDTPQFQLSLPYLHQNQIQWCDFECKQQPQTNQETEQANGWHLILRFAQQTQYAFAIESHLKQEQLAVTLWANESQQLKHLHQNIPLIKNKLEQAGFKIDSITSKHGAPKPLHQPIQQSLIDVHT
jgi:hypothetical protein